MLARKPRLLPLLAALLTLPCAAGPVRAADDAELRALRDEVTQLRRAYEQRIAALEQRLAAAEANSATAAPVAALPPPAAPPGANAFNPDISLILAGTYTRLTQPPTRYQDAPDPRNYQIHGFVDARGETAPPRRSFALGESELSLAANIDPSWRGQFTAALAPEGGSVEVEEAFIRSLALGNGLSLKAGRFFSGIGYMNAQHAHAWDFADAPLAYKAFFANQLRNDGVQLKWLAPTELFVELGAELAGGASFPATDRNKNGTTLGTLFAHAGGDIGIAQSWRAGLSAVATHPQERAWNDLDSLGATVENRFSGDSRSLLVDAVWKWAPNGDARERSLTLQGEALRRRENGAMTYNATAAAGAAAATQTGSYAATQSGFYAQGVYKFRPDWRAGYRYDRLDSGNTALGLVAGGALRAADFPLLSSYRPTRHSLMVDYATSEFARFRVQVARDAARYDFATARPLRDTQLWLQYVVNLGAHGAHQY